VHGIALQKLSHFEGPLVLTADVHIGEGEDRGRMFIQLLRRYRDLPVVVLGDLFSYWYERWGKVPARYMPYLEEITSLGRKVPVFLLPGNRDLLAGGALTKRSGGAVIVEKDVVRLPSRGVVLTHGDLLTSGDSQYRIYRFLMSSGMVSALARLVPQLVAEWVAFRLRGMSAAEKRRKGKKLTGLDLDVARKMFDADVEGIICGHFHPEWLVTYRGLRNWIRILPDWGIAPGNHAILNEAGGFEYHAQ
jgi:UDP-2,3-diacylglucosamine pyrophosphatase LpxH